MLLNFYNVRMENYLDLQSTFKFNISVNFQRNQVRFNPDGFLIINGFKIKIIEKFAIYCSKKIFDVYSSEKMNNNYVKDRNIMKITIEKDEKLLKWMLTQDNLCILQSFFCMKSIIFTKNNMEFLKFISNELEIAILQNSLIIYEKFIEENVAFSSRSIKVLKDDENFQNMLKNYIFEKDPDIKKDQIQKMINLHLDDHYFYQSITLFFISYPMQVDKFISILKEMNKLNEYSNYLNKNLEIKSAFRAEKQYLLNLLQSKKEDGCQNQKDKSIINCMLHLIRNDDVNEFQKISASIPSFDYNLKFKLEQSFPENRITLFSNISEFFEGETNQHNFNYIDFAAFYGSINIFKYLLMMKVEFNRFTALFAVSGGNIEIIHLCEQNKCNFKNALKCAIIYRHVELVDWLIDTINVDNFESFIDDMIFFHQNDLILKFINLSHSEKIIQQLIIKSIVYDNYQLFLFLNDVEKIDLKFKYDKNKGNIFSLLSNCSNIKFYEYLFNLTDQKLILEARDIYGQTPAHIAAIKGNLLLLKFLVEKKVNIESLAFDDLTPLHFACMYGQYEIVKFITSLE